MQTIATLIISVFVTTAANATLVVEAAKDPVNCNDKAQQESCIEQLKTNSIGDKKLQDKIKELFVRLEVDSWTCNNISYWELTYPDARSQAGLRAETSLYCYNYNQSMNVPVKGSVIRTETGWKVSIDDKDLEAKQGE